MLSKKDARTFFFAATAITFLIFLVLTWHSMVVAVPEQTNDENITPAVVRGKLLFDENNCMGCHTILGEGAYYAPELTKVMERRGEAYVNTVLTYKGSWAPKGRKMVAYDFTKEEAEDIIAFLKWIGEMDLNGFPPEPPLKK